jgi:glycogen operon protein
MNLWHAREGSPTPFGATWIESEQAYNFAIYSKHASSVVLLLYSENDIVNPVYTYRMAYPANKTGRIWHCRIPVSAAVNARFYAYMIEGSFEPSAGHRFDPKKVLLDPYARVVFFPKDFSRDAASRPGSNAGRGPLGLLPLQDGGFDWGYDHCPDHTHDTIVYELHVKGFTNSIAFRKAHPSLCRSRFWREDVWARKWINLLSRMPSLSTCAASRRMIGTSM